MADGKQSWAEDPEGTYDPGPLVTSLSSGGTSAVLTGAETSHLSRNKTFMVEVRRCWFLGGHPGKAIPEGWDLRPDRGPRVRSDFPDVKVRLGSDPCG